MAKFWDFKNGLPPNTFIPPGSWNLVYKNKEGLSIIIVERLYCISQISLIDYQKDGFYIMKAERV